MAISKVTSTLVCSQITSFFIFRFPPSTLDWENVKKAKIVFIILIFIFC
jgi:hypothetical protein